MSYLPEIPPLKESAILLVSLFPTTTWQKETIVHQMTMPYDGFAEAQGEVPAQAASDLPSLEWIDWTREDEGNRIDAYSICDNARETGWDHVFFVTGNSLAGDRTWLENRDESLVLAYWGSHDKQQIQALRVRMKSIPEYTGPKPVHVLQRLRQGSDMQHLGEWVQDANLEQLTNPEEKLLENNVKQEPSSFETAPRSGSLRVKKSVAENTSISILSPFTSSRSERIKTEILASVGDSLAFRSLESIQYATRADLFHFMKQSRNENGRPYSFLLFLADSDSESTATVYAALYEKNIATHAESVQVKEITWSTIRNVHSSIDTVTPELTALFNSMETNSDVKIILDPTGAVCKRNLVQDSLEYHPWGEDTCYTVWATAKFTPEEEQTISNELHTLYEGVEDVEGYMEGFTEGTDPGDPRQDVDSRLTAGINECGPKAHILVSWEPDRQCTPEDMLAIYKEVRMIDDNCVPIFVDRATLEDKQVIVVDWKDNPTTEEDEWEYEGVSDSVLKGKGLLMGRAPGRRALNIMQGIQTSNMPFLDHFEKEDLMIIQEGGNNSKQNLSRAKL